MKLTEEEAKDRWCPFARVNAADDLSTPAVNRWGRGDPNDSITLCIASSCMMWRWDAEPVPQPEDGFDDKMVCERGHCGLAGDASGRPSP